MGHVDVTRAPWGKTAEEMSVEIFTIASPEMTVRVTTFGARVVSIEVPDRDGVKADVVLGHGSVGEYEVDTTYLGAIVGRYGNRIAGGRFFIDGEEFRVPQNNNGNALHGGPQGFDQKVWMGREIEDGVEMTLVSADGEMGFPGELTVSVSYRVEGRELRIAYCATTTKTTVVNLTNHSYFNLAGEGWGDVLGHVMMLNADRYTPVSRAMIPTGELALVAGTPMDFLTPTAIGDRIDAEDEQLKNAGGYDHNWVLNDSGAGLRLVGRAYDPASGRSLAVKTTEPGVQFYSGNFLDGTRTGKSGGKYEKHSGFCLETQHFPDSPNHAEFPSTVLRAGETYRSETVFAFGIEP
jgi:aldose 1-epimerase